MNEINNKFFLEVGDELYLYQSQRGFYDTTKIVRVTKTQAICANGYKLRRKIYKSFDGYYADLIGQSQSYYRIRFYLKTQALQKRAEKEIKEKEERKRTVREFKKVYTNYVNLSNEQLKKLTEVYKEFQKQNEETR